MTSPDFVVPLLLDPEEQTRRLALTMLIGDVNGDLQLLALALHGIALKHPEVSQDCGTLIKRISGTSTELEVYAAGIAPKKDEKQEEVAPLPCAVLH
jgi:hypothetical protein